MRSWNEILDKADLLAAVLETEGFQDFEREHRFHPVRKWRLDFAWPAQQLAVEVEGGVWTGGRHTRGAGFMADCEKYNELACAGWRLIRVTPQHVKRGEALHWIRRALNREQNGTTSQG